LQDALGEDVFNQLLAGTYIPTISDLTVLGQCDLDLSALSDIGGLLGIPTPMNDALITVASVMNGDDYRSWGRTLKSLGLDRLTKRNIRGFLRTGEI